MCFIGKLVMVDENNLTMNSLLENTSSGSQYTALLGKCQARYVTAKRVRRTLKVRWVNLFKQKGSWLIFGDFTTRGIFY